jgi:hypothetical protein
MAVRLPLAVRPGARAECVDGPRPCPWYGCRHHLGLHQSAGGELRVRELEDLAETCVLDLVDANPDGMPLEAIAAAIGLGSVEAVRTIETKALSKIPGRSPGLRDHAAEDHRDRARRSTGLVQDAAQVEEVEETIDATPEEDAGCTFLDSDAAACALVHRILEKRACVRALVDTSAPSTQQRELVAPAGDMPGEKT